MTRVPTIAVLSMKGGVGKTTTVLGLASAALHRGLRTLVIDLDPQGNATMGLAVEAPTFTVGDVLADARPGVAQQALQKSPWGEGIDVLAADRSLEHRNRPEGPHSEQRLRVSLASLPQHYDLVLIDCPPSLGEMTRNALHAATAALVVTEPSYFALHGAEQAKEAVELVQRESNPALRDLRIIINKARTTLAEHRFRITELTDRYGEHVSEVLIPERQAVEQAEGAGVPIHEWDSPAGRELATLFDTLLASYLPKKTAFNWGFLR